MGEVIKVQFNNTKGGRMAQTFDLRDSDQLEFYTDTNGEHLWRVTAGNGVIIASATEGYSSREKAVDNFNRDRSADRVELYTDKAGEWRFRARQPNGDIVAASTEGYASRSSCIASMERHGYGVNQIEESNYE